jgi:hypothetical protein
MSIRGEGFMYLHVHHPLLTAWLMVDITTEGKIFKQAEVS